MIFALILSLSLALGPRDVVFVGARAVGSDRMEGEVVDLYVHAGKVTVMGKDLPRRGADVIDVAGRWIAPAFIDSHVHLLYRDYSRELPKGGVAAAVDLGAPDAFFDTSFGNLQVVGSGPFLVAERGYPTESWGTGGFGREVFSVEGAIAAVERIAAHRAKVIKVAFGAGPDLSDDISRAIVTTAHRLKLVVAVHALSDAAAAKAAELGCDILAHVPVEPLAETTVAAWSKGYVIPTLAAFGGSASAVENLRRLRAAGAKVLYGTDLGNTSEPRISADELALMRAAGMDGEGILDAGTRSPARLWGFARLGRLGPGQAASFLVLDADPRVDPTTLSRPSAVYIDGVRQ